jgi:hypothetical protein
LCGFKDGPGWRAVVYDTKGEPRPKWVPRILEALSKSKPAKPEDLKLEPRHADGIRELGVMCESDAPETATLECAGFFRFVPEEKTPAT